MRIILFLVTLHLFICSQAQPTLQKLDSKSLPKAIKFKGHVKNAVTWKDNAGIHTVITSETGIVDSKTENDLGNRDAELFAYHYLSTNDHYRLTWQLYDCIKDCPVDINASFVKNTFAVTDLNKNGHAEVWLMYRTVCHGDISPSNMKIVMYENEKKYAVRGTAKVQVSASEYYGGGYQFDEAFRRGPEIFRNYAKVLWQRNIMEAAY